MNDFDSYLDRVRAIQAARKPITRDELQIIGVYVGLLLIATIVAFATRY